MLHGCRSQSRIAIMFFLFIMFIPVDSFASQVRINVDLESKRIDMAILEFSKIIRESSAFEGVDVFYQQELVKFGQGVSAVKEGIADVGIIEISNIRSVVSDFKLFSLPFLFEDSNEFLDFTNGDQFSEMRTRLSNEGLILLDSWSIGFSQLFSKIKIDDVSELKGLKLRAPFGSLESELYQALGAAPVQASFGEIHPALASGAIDAAILLPESAQKFGLFEVTQFMTNTNERLFGASIIVNSSFWHSLSDEQQAVLRGGARRAAEVGREAASAMDEDIAGLMAEEGVEIVVPTQASLQGWLSQARPIWEKSGVPMNVFEFASNTDGGGDPCKLGTCRCTNKTCSKDCCKRKKDR